MLALQGPFPIDENGIEIRPGYRPPFKKGEFDSRRFVPPKGVRPKVGPQKPNLLAAIRKAFKRHALATAGATDPDLAMRHAKVAKLFFEMECKLTNQLKPSKLHHKPHLHGVTPSSKIEPLPSGNHTINPTTTHPATEQAPIAPVSPIPPKPAEIDDCPF